MSKNEVAAQAIEWFSRTITILIVMVGPGLLGNWLDQQFGTEFLAIVGTIAGVTLSTFVLLLLAKQLTPPARGEALADDEERPDAPNE